MFLLPGVVIAWMVTDTHIPPVYAAEIINYLVSHANPVDGGWGLHTEGDSTVFGTSLNYTVLRLLGVEAEHPVMIQARRLLHRLGGALNAPHWSKFWLAVLGVCDWEIVNPIPPEGLAAARLGAIGPMEMVGAYPTSLPANVVDLVEAMDGPGDGRYQSPTTGVVCSVMGQH